MGSMKVLIITAVATVALLVDLAREAKGQTGSNPQQQTVQCKPAEKSKKVTVSVPRSTVTFQCQSSYEFDPAVTGSPESQKVYSKLPGDAMQPLTTYCPTATLKAVENPSREVNKAAATLHVEALPKEAAVFYVQCKPAEKERNANEPCVVEVTVNQAGSTGEATLPQDQTGGAGQAGGVHVCTQRSITVSLPNKDSTVRFSCDNQFNLYPTAPEKVFKDDCKTEENLKDMTRTHAAAATPGVGARSAPLVRVAQPIYTLTANKKPPKKRLCYLCAKQEASDTAAGPPENYCAVYVESSARAQFGLGVTVGLILFVLAGLRFT